MSDSDFHPIPEDRAEGGLVRPLRANIGADATPVKLETPPPVRDCLDILKNTCGDNLVAVIFFGSCLLGTSPDSGSAADFFVIVDDYRDFYRDLGARLPAARRASIMAFLNCILPPNIIHLEDPSDLGMGSKCFIISRGDIDLALSNRSPDYFCRGRLVQRVHIIHARSADIRQALEKQMEQARRASLDWVPLYLHAIFTVHDYCQRMLEVSYAGEIRPESSGRVAEVFEAQRTYFLLTYGRMLDDAVIDGTLQRIEGGYRLAVPPSISYRLRWRLFFMKSKLRATCRWIKYMLTFDGWLDYIVRKVERRTGLQLTLTRAERRAPILFLWPKVFQVLRARRSQRARSNDGKKSGMR